MEMTETTAARTTENRLKPRNVFPFLAAFYVHLLKMKGKSKNKTVMPSRFLMVQTYLSRYYSYHQKMEKDSYYHITQEGKFDKQKEVVVVLYKDKEGDMYAKHVEDPEYGKTFIKIW